MRGLHSACQLLPLAALGGDEGIDDTVTLNEVYIALDTTTPAPQDDAEPSLVSRVMSPRVCKSAFAKRFCRSTFMIRMLLILVIVAVIPSIVHPNDLSKVPLWDGETIDCRGTLNEELLANRFGGSVVVGERLVISHTATTVHSGRGGFELNATIGEDHAGFAGIALTGFAPTNEIDTRDLSRFEEVSLWLKNETEAPFTFSLEIKDFRDSGDHRAKREFVIGASNKWQELTALLPPTPANGWMVTGTPDISRIKLMTFVIESDRGLAVNGSIFLDDVFLSETGGALDVAIVPINDILRRLAKRTFAALWGSRDRDTGLVPQ